MTATTSTPSGPNDTRPARGRLHDRINALLRPPADDDALIEDAPALTVRAAARRFWPDARPLRWWMLVLVALGGAISAIMIVEIILFGHVVDHVLVPADIGALPIIAAAFLGLALLSGVLSGLDDYATTWVSQRFLVGLRTKVFGHVVSLPAEVHDRRRLGDSLTRLTSDVSSVQGLMISSSIKAASSVVTGIFYLVALCWLDPLLTLVSLVVVPIFWYVAAKLSSLIKLSSREQQRRGGAATAIAEEHLGSVSIIQSFNRQDEAVQRFRSENVGIMQANLSASRVRALFSPAVDIAELVGLLSVILLGTYALGSGRLSLGELLAFLTLMAQLYTPMRQLAELVPRVLTDAAGAERLAELLDERPPPEAPDALALSVSRAGVELRAATVTYQGMNRPALDHTDLSVQPGEIVAVVGPSGAGKSTLVKLLTRSLDPERGRVLLANHDLRRLTLHSVRSTVAVVPQEPLLLDASVLDNLLLARPDASHEQVLASAREADADEFIRSLPDGYATRVGQRGRSLSGGQRQRLAIARALLTGSPVLVLDEPTTGLDADTARRVLAPLRHQARERTTIIVTHDPVARETADRVVTLRDGRMVATQDPAGGTEAGS